ncbi:MAG: DUF2797 domain-containing protein [Gammaproteobacteria bacterium]|nr:DUF2797 domain-containing protein [Gammaproteobacteria bacterium]HJP35982.1 DUF2797 domain-containing protein [Gammaproteobacteria bacterium]
MQGTLSKMTTHLADVVEYALPLGGERLALNPLIGKTVTLRFTGRILCDSCGRRTNRSFAQGHCYPCMKKLAACDLCIMKPETCHFHLGTCREPEWGERHCMINHVVYLANTSDLKVGITRESQVPTRWMDQGATQALPIFRARTRQLSGLLEVALAETIADKTNWRTLLKGDNEAIDLAERGAEAAAGVMDSTVALRRRFGDDAVERLKAKVVEIRYPVTVYPQKIRSLNFDKNPTVEGTLIGIKGQYLIFDTGVINIRKFTGYEIDTRA